MAPLLPSLMTAVYLISVTIGISAALLLRVSVYLSITMCSPECVSVIAIACLSVCYHVITWQKGPGRREPIFGYIYDYLLTKVGS